MSFPRPALAGLAALSAVAALVLALGCRTAGGDVTPAGEIWWPRFPFASDTHVERELAVLYTTDGLGPNTTLADLGYPGRKIFRLHEDHPDLHVVLTSCPASRYSGGRPVDPATEAGQSWRMLAMDTRFAWIELANQGYSHAPDDDSNLNHHEFSIRQTGCNIDHTRLGTAGYCRDRFRLAREAYRRLGIPDTKVSLVRFPGGEDSPAALQAALEAGFVGVLRSGQGERPGGDARLPSGGSDILEIRSTKLMSSFARSEELETALMQDRIEPAGLADSAEFKAAVRRGESLAEKTAADGGILNLSDQWRETFAIIGGVAPRYLLLDAVLDAIEKRHGPRVWYPAGRELALWLDARRNTKTSLVTDAGALLIHLEVPGSWAVFAPDGMTDASIVVPLPDGWVSWRVRVRQGAEQSGWQDLEAGRSWRHPRGLALAFSLGAMTTIRIEQTR